MQKLRVPFLLLTLTMCGSVEAGNTFFWLGDSYFHFRLSDEVSQEFEKAAKAGIEMKYERPNFSHGDFGGQRGYPLLTLTDCDEGLGQRVRAAYKSLRKVVSKIVQVNEGNETVVLNEMNAPHAFIYNKTFDFRQYSIGLKFNEAFWDELGKESSRGTRARMWYDSFAKSPDAVAEDWRDSRRVDPLAVLPNASRSSLSIGARDVVIVVVSGTVDGCIEMKEGEMFDVVSADKSVTYECRDGEWVIGEALAD